jgi:hypothetical protein
VIKRTLVITRLIACLVLVGAVAQAAPTRTTPTRTNCPRLIAEKAGELYYPRENYKCFSSVREAQRAGFLSSRALVAPDYSGWWRLNLKLSANSCGGATSSPSDTTYFLQLKHDRTSGLFGSLCPGNDRFVGALPRTDPKEGFTVSSLSSASADPFCNGGPSEISYMLEARSFDSFFSESKVTRLTQVKVCLNDQSRRCRATWSGNGARETTDHRFWPQVSNDLGEFSASCTAALNTCQGCHAAPR